MGDQAACVCLPGIPARRGGNPRQRRGGLVHDHKQRQTVQETGSGAHRRSYPAYCTVKSPGQHAQSIVKHGRARSWLLVGRAHPTDLRGLLQRASSGTCARLHTAGLRCSPGVPVRVPVAGPQVPGESMRVFASQHEPPHLVHGPDTDSTRGSTQNHIKACRAQSCHRDSYPGDAVVIQPDQPLFPGQ